MLSCASMTQMNTALVVGKKHAVTLWRLNTVVITSFEQKKVLTYRISAFQPDNVLV